MTRSISGHLQGAPVANHQQDRGRTARRSVVALGSRLVAAGCVLVLSACDSLDRLLSVDAPSRVLANGLDVPANAALLVNSAGTDFECAFGHYVLRSEERRVGKGRRELRAARRSKKEDHGP